MVKDKIFKQRGEASGLLIAVIFLSVFLIGALIFGGWAFFTYNEQKNDFDSRVEIAKKEAQKDQAQKDEEKYEEYKKTPYTQFVGPDSMGRLVFDYPKTWSAYVDQDQDQLKAYLHPTVVHPISSKKQFALTVSIEDKPYDKVLLSYESKIKKGDLNTQPINVKGVAGTRLDGLFKKDVRGAAVIFKVRDKTLTIMTEADVFKPDFEKLIPTIEFKQ